MANRAYTIDDTPAVVARIERELSHIVDVVKRADPHLDSLVLTGGFARGEGATLDGAPQNDYDLIAIRSFGRPKRPYPHVKQELEATLGMHIDLATVAKWRLGWVAPSIFWYETALRGRILAGPDRLAKIPIQEAGRIDPKEGLRLLVNRSAGLLFATESTDDNEWRLQAAKALLAALDAWMLTTGTFAPSHRERWTHASALHRQGALPPDVLAHWPWLQWAYQSKVDPAHAAPRDPKDAWRAAAQAIHTTLPHALRHAGLESIEEYGRVGSLVERFRYFLAAGHVPGADRLAPHPTGSVRVATLRLLKASLDGVVPPDAARTHLEPLAKVDGRPLGTLETLRGATAQ